MSLLTVQLPDMAVPTIHNQISANKAKTWLIMFLFSLFIASVVYIFALGSGFEGAGALSYVGIALIITGIINFFSYYNSDKMVMAISGAKQIDRKSHEELFEIVENLCIGNGQKMPKIYIIEDTAPNAFATGRDPDHASIAFTTGIIQKLNKLELEGVAAHELSHVKNFDTRLMTIVSILVGTVALLADFFLRMTFYGRNKDREGGGAFFAIIALIAAILAPLVAQLIQLSISRKREFLADASSALLTRYPDALADALIKISSDKEPLEVANRGTAHLYIVNPLKGQEVTKFFAKLFNTHPPVEERVKALRDM
jgi:heat shock protein HtpX